MPKKTITQPTLRMLALRLREHDNPILLAQHGARWGSWAWEDDAPVGLSLFEGESGRGTWRKLSVVEAMMLTQHGRAPWDIGKDGE